MVAERSPKRVGINQAFSAAKITCVAYDNSLAALETNRQFYYIYAYVTYCGKP